MVAPNVNGRLHLTGVHQKTFSFFGKYDKRKTRGRGGKMQKWLKLRPDLVLSFKTALNNLFLIPALDFQILHSCRSLFPWSLVKKCMNYFQRFSSELDLSLHLFQQHIIPLSEQGWSDFMKQKRLGMFFRFFFIVFFKKLYFHTLLMFWLSSCMIASF